jgi:opacity protein-like surface antigen
LFWLQAGGVVQEHRPPASPDFPSTTGNLLAAAKTSDQTDQENKMKFKAILAATTACALIATAPSATAGDLYVSVFGGANFLSDSSAGEIDNPGSNQEVFAWNSDADTGFVLGGAIGTSLDRWAQGLKVELEVSYRRNDVGGGWSVEEYSSNVISTTAVGQLDANMSTFALMANIWYEFDIGSKARPYIGGGAGWARANFDGALTEGVTSGFSDAGGETDWDLTNNGFAWQLGVGLNYEVSPGVDVGLGYRYFSGPAFDEPFSVDTNFVVQERFGKVDNDSHAVAVNLNININ